MATYYDLTLDEDIPHGSDILNKPCTVVFTYPDGAHSHDYTGTLFARFAANRVQISSAYMNIEAAWEGADGGTLSINTGHVALQFPIAGFANVGQDALFRTAPEPHWVSGGAKMRELPITLPSLQVAVIKIPACIDESDHSMLVETVAGWKNAIVATSESMCADEPAEPKQKHRQ